MRKLLSLLIICLAFNLVVAKDMVEKTEEFYVAQGIFESLAIVPEDCALQDDLISFACGRFASTVQLFQEGVNQYIGEFLPGLRPVDNWFNNAGTVARAYESDTGRYLVGYNTGGYIVIAFTPR